MTGALTSMRPLRSPDNPSVVLGRDHRSRPPMASSRELYCPHARCTDMRRSDEEKRPDLRRGLLRRRQDNRHLLPPCMQGANPAPGKRVVLSECSSGGARGILAMPALPPRDDTVLPGLEWNPNNRRGQTNPDVYTLTRNPSSAGILTIALRFGANRNLLPCGAVRAFGHHPQSMGSRDWARMLTPAGWFAQWRKSATRST
jgi:hypothetical protein